MPIISLWKVDYLLRSTTFWGRLSFSTLVFLHRLCFEVDHVSRSTMYRDSTVCILVEIAFLIFRNLMQGNIILFVSGKTACLVVTYHHESCQVANFLFRANFDGSDWHPKLDFPLGPSTLNLMVCQSTYNREVKKLNPALKCIKKGFL